jgi:hypothetical protein
MESVEHSLPDQIALDRYMRANRARRRRGAGVTFQKLVPHGAVLPAGRNPNVTFMDGNGPPW